MSNRAPIFLLGIIVLVHVFILTKLIYYPYPELFVYPYLTNHGLKPYSQIIDQHFPGLLFLPVNFDNLGLSNEIVARWWSIGIVITSHLLLFFISSKILKSSKKALLVNFLFLIWQPFFEGWILWIDSFLPILLLPAFYSLYKKKIFLAGILMGVAIIFKQVMLPLAIFLAIYIFWDTRKIKQVGLFFLGLAPPIMLMLLYLLSIEVINDFWYWTIIFNLTIYAKSGRGLGPTLSHFLRAGLVFGTALFILRKIKIREIQILLIFLLGTLLGLSTRFDFVHFQPALPFALIATVYGLSGIWRNPFLKFFILSYILISIWWLNIFYNIKDVASSAYKGHISNEGNLLSFGKKVFFFDKQTKMIASKIRQYTKEDEKIFIFGPPPHLYQMANRLPAGNIFVFQFPWFLKVAGARILEGIEKDKPEIVISDRTIMIEEQNITDFAKEIDQYIQKNYEVIDQVGTTSILRRKMF